MERSLCDEVVAALGDERLVFDWFPDRDALMLLAWACGDGARVAEVRAGPWARLLQRPAVRRVLAERGDGRLSAADLYGTWPADPKRYVLTLGTWEGSQTTRRGANVVLQVNFSTRHDIPFERLVASRHGEVFTCRGHPVSDRRHTLAWARIDLDFDTDEALIEEIQSDWVREGDQVARWLDQGRRYDLWTWAGPLDRAADPAPLRRYLDDVLADHRRGWAEATLAAALWWLREQVGIRTVWYHSWQGGNRLKRCDAPRSLYTRLPRRVAFEDTAAWPEMLVRWRRGRLRKRLPEVRWHRLVFPRDVVTP